MCRRAKIQEAVLRDFQKRWCHEYLTSLRDFHKASGSNKQVIKKGDVVLFHDDAPRVTWKMAVIQDLMVGGDGLVRAGTIHTATGITSRSITRLYPLELSLDNQSKEPREHPTMSVQQPSEPHPVNSADENSRSSASICQEGYQSSEGVGQSPRCPPGGCRGDRTVT